MKRGFMISGWAAFTAFWLVGGAFESFLIGWADFLVLSAGLAVGAIASLYGWFCAALDEQERARKERRRRE